MSIEFCFQKSILIRSKLSLVKEKSFELQLFSLRTHQNGCCMSKLFLAETCVRRSINLFITVIVHVAAIFAFYHGVAGDFSLQRAHKHTPKKTMQWHLSNLLSYNPLLFICVSN